jgi:hypothetical protein
MIIKFLDNYKPVIFSGTADAISLVSAESAHFEFYRHPRRDDLFFLNKNSYIWRF